MYGVIGNGINVNRKMYTFDEVDDEIIEGDQIDEERYVDDEENETNDNDTDENNMPYGADRSNGSDSGISIKVVPLPKNHRISN
jgi:hypothetical protein